MSQLTSTLREAAEKNQELLSVLAATDYAPASLQQNKTYIADLKAQIANTDSELSRLHKITEDERKDHLSYRDSNVKRWAYKLRGSKGKEKFTSKSEMEEKEFLEAWQKERSAKESRDELAAALSQAEKDRTHLESDAARQGKVQEELDALYQSIFSGPTPEVPGEDERERDVQNAKQTFDQAQSAARNEKLALDSLSKAKGTLQAAYMEIQAALRRSNRDMFLGGGTFTDMMERDALAAADHHIQNTLRQIESARRMQPAIQPLTQISIDQGHFFSDVLFDNIFTDMAQHERIQGSERDIVQAIESLRKEKAEQGKRVEQANRSLKETGDALERSRRELQRIRAEAFERVASGQEAGVAPPAYQAEGPTTAA